MQRQYRQPKKAQEFESTVIDIARVTRVSAGGKHFRFRAVVVAGDKKGKVGLGIAKGMDVAQAIQKATRRAQKSFFTIPLLEGTIPHPIQAKFGASKIILRPQRKGRGLIAGGVVRVISKHAGIQDISAKFLSHTHNKLTNAKAVILAFQKLRAKISKTSIPQQETTTQSVDVNAKTE